MLYCVAGAAAAAATAVAEAAGTFLRCIQGECEVTLLCALFRSCAAAGERYHAATAGECV